jgi:hypothetical protein
MATITLAQRVKKLEHELERTKAFSEIINLLSKMQYYHMVNDNKGISTLFAKRADTRLYFGDMGYWIGADAPDKGAKTFEGMSNVGMMALHLMTNPCIEVAGDGKTAKGIWIASGIVANRNRQTGKPSAGWEWNRYGIDFIKEDGKWKLWHHHVFPLFQIGWNENWAEHFEKKKEGPGGMPGSPFKPDYPPTPADVSYSPDSELPLIPAPAEPYETFDPKQIY